MPGRTPGSNQGVPRDALAINGDFPAVAGKPRRPWRVLLVGAPSETAEAIGGWLGDLPANLIHQRDVTASPTQVGRARPDLILMDLGHLEDRAWHAFEALRGRGRGVVPILLMSGSENPEAAATALELGAADFMRLPIHPRELRARVKMAIEAKHRRDELSRQARHDPLTELANRRSLDQRIESDLKACRDRGRPLALWMADLDRFKRINDRHGHDAGDAALRWVADVLKRCSGGRDVGIRFGGEEFLVISPGRTADSAAQVAETFRAQVERGSPTALGLGVKLTVSAGLAVSMPSWPVDGPTLLRRADRALYAAKRSGRNSIWRWDDELGRETPLQWIGSG